jgi:hypothetical protein
MASPEDANQPGGDLKLDYIDLITSDGKLVHLQHGAWVKLELSEDIYQSYLSGRLHMHDSTNLPQSLELTGNEIIRFRFSTPGLSPIEFVGRIIKVGERVETGDSSIGYTLNFLSRELVSSLQSKVRKSYTGKTYSSVVESVYNDYLRQEVDTKPLYVESTLTPKSIVVPGWDPIKTIRKLADRSVSSNPKYDNGTYLFFERCDDGNHVPGKSGFVFTSLESMWDPVLVKDPSQTYTYEWSNVEANEPGASIVDFVNEEVKMNTLNNIKNGLYASKLVTHDLVKRKVFFKTFDYTQEYNRHTNMNPNSEKGRSTAMTNSRELTRASESYEIYAPRHHMRYDDIDLSSFEADRVLNRNSTLQQLNNQVIEIGVIGDSQRRVGDIIEFYMPSPETVGKDGPKRDKYMSGRWMITAITHNLSSNPQKYTMVIELSRNSIYGGLPEQTVRIDPSPKTPVKPLSEVSAWNKQPGASPQGKSSSFIDDADW